MFKHSVTVLVVTSLIGLPLSLSPAMADNPMGYKLLSADQASGLPRMGGALGMSVGPDKQITDDDTDFGFQGTTVNSHATLAGYLFYDVRELDDPAMKGAELYVKEIRTADGKQQLFAFQIPLDKWLAAQDHPSPRVPQKSDASRNTPDTLPTPR